MLIVNNYEISDWEEYYLKLWSTDTSKDYVHSGVILASLSVSEYPIFKNYFRPFCNKVSITSFIEFICIFAFFTNEQLIPLIFTLNNIQSNRVVTEQQVMMLFKSLQVDSVDTNDIRKDMFEIQRDPNGFLPLTEVTNLLKLNRILLQGIEKLRNHIIQKVIKDEYFITIKRRIFYFNQYPPDDGYIRPKESCLTYITRKLFSCRPPNYYYDHKPLNKYIQLDETLFTIRKRYGYSSRPDRNSSVSLSNYNNSRHNSAANYSHTLRSRASTSILNNVSLKPENRSISTTILNPKTPMKNKSIYNEYTINNNENNKDSSNKDKDKDSNSTNTNTHDSNHNSKLGSVNNLLQYSKQAKCNHISVKIVPIDGEDINV